MATKDYSSINTNRVYDQLNQATDETPAKKRKSRKTYTEEEAKQFKMDGTTSGKKGVKRDRINMAFAPDVYDFIKVMSRITGLSMTEFVNVSLRSYMKDHDDIYKQAIAIREKL